MRITKWLQVIAVGLLFFTSPGFDHGAAAAKVSGKYATLVIDANSGKVLHAYKARQLRYPASLTKMMTLYLIFECIEERKLSYQTLITATENAARRPPSKIGLKPGNQITVRQAVKALVTKSANDVATAVAEHIAGTERAFSRLMSQKARQLGMTQTVFRNASGLPDKEQVTTAHDMAQLALQLRDHFPNHYHHFKTRVFHYKGKTFKNHNALLGRYSGVDGIKTGYVRASGFNLVTSVRQRRRNIVAVVMGGKTSRARNATMRRLLAKHVKSGTAVATRKPDIRVAWQQRPVRQISVPVARRAQRPAAKPARPAPKIEIARVRNIDIAATTRSEKHNVNRIRQNQSTPRPLPDSKKQSPGVAFAMATLSKSGGAPSYSRALQNARPLPSAPQQRATPRRNTATAVRGTNMAPPLERERQPLGTMPAAIQVGAYSTLGDANRQLASIAAKAGSLLADFRPIALLGKSGKRDIYRARFAGYSPQKATATCYRLKKMGIDCFVVRTQ